MTGPSPTALRAYRVTCAFVGVLALGFGAVFAEEAAAGVDPVWVRRAVAGLAFGAVGATYLAPWGRPHARGLTYVVFHAAIVGFAALCVASGYAPAYAVATVFVVTVLGLGGGISSESVGSMAACIGAAVGLPVAGLLLVEAPRVDPLGYAALLVASGAAVLLLVQRRVRGRAALAAERERYRLIFERATDGIYIAHAETQRVLDANPAYLALTGYTISELRALQIEDLVHVPNGERPVADVLADVRERGGELVGPRQHRARDGRLLDVDVSVNPIGYEDHSVLCVLVRDASRQRETERQLREAAAKAEAAHARAEELLQLKASLLHNMSHEIRTPLTGILGYADLLTETVEGESLEMVRVIDRGARRLMSTLNSVLDLAQLESGAVVLETGPVDLAAEAEDVRDALASVAQTKGIALDLDRPAGPVWVEAEAGALARILNNLVGNAIKFTAKGAVRVRIGVDETGPVLVVSDTGIGIPAAFLPHLFDEFRQASHGDARQHEGSGLGLAICHRLADVLGGTIGVESTEGVGTVFTVRLPAAPEPATPEPAERSAEIAGAAYV